MLASLKEKALCTLVAVVMVLVLLSLGPIQQPSLLSINRNSSIIDESFAARAIYFVHILLMKDQMEQNVTFSLPPVSLQNQTICLVSLHDYDSGEMKEINTILSQHKKDFAVAHHMGFIDVNPVKYRKLYSNLSSTWFKLPALYDLISNDLESHEYDWFMWIDADVMFTNSSCTFQNLLSINHHVIVPGDFNTGVFLIRNHPWSLNFLQTWFSLWPRFSSIFGEEDVALSHVIIEQKIWNRYIHDMDEHGFKTIASYPNVRDFKSAWHPGNCIFHAAGFYFSKAGILKSCLKSEFDCVNQLNQFYAANGGTAYLPLSDRMKRIGY
jgi:hypothetical protein